MLTAISSKRAVSCASDNRILIWDFEEDDENFDVRKAGQCVLSFHYYKFSI